MLTITWALAASALLRQPRKAASSGGLGSHAFRASVCARYTELPAVKPAACAMLLLLPRTGLSALVGLRGTSNLRELSAYVSGQELGSSPTRQRDPFNATAACDSHSQAAAGPLCARPAAQHRFGARRGAAPSAPAAAAAAPRVVGRSERGEASYFFASSLGKLSHHRCDGIGRVGASGRCCGARARRAQRGD